MVGHLTDDDSDHNEVAQVGEEEENEDDEINSAVQQRLEKRRYTNKYANYSNEANQKQVDFLRKSSELWGRRSITSNAIMRRTSVFSSKSGISDIASRAEFQ